MLWKRALALTWNNILTNHVVNMAAVEKQGGTMLGYLRGRKGYMLHELVLALALQKLQLIWTNMP